MRSATGDLLAAATRSFAVTNPANIPLALERQEPASEAQGVEPNTPILFYFNRPIDPALLHRTLVIRPGKLQLVAWSDRVRTAFLHFWATRDRPQRELDSRPFEVVHATVPLVEPLCVDSGELAHSSGEVGFRCVDK